MYLAQVFQLDQRSKDLRTSSAPQAPSATGRPARVVHNLTHLNKRQRARLHKPAREQLTHEAMVPLNALWERYAAQVGSAGGDAAQELDLHGAQVTVVASTTPSLVGCTVRCGM